MASAHSSDRTPVRLRKEILLGENSAGLPDCEFGAREDRDSQCARGEILDDARHGGLR